MSEYHEEGLSEQAKDFHRMIKSVMEELEAVDWYNQRADVTNDQELKAVVEHNRDEEIEHACMGLEWLRRNNPVFDEMLRTFLFRGDIPITEIEEAIEEGGEAEAEAGEEESNSNGSLGLGNLRGGN